MKTTSLNRARAAFTVAEMLFVAGAFALVIAVCLPGLVAVNPHHYASCPNNLRQIGVAFNTWALDNNDRFPMQVSTNNSGTQELAGGPEVYAHFQVLSNELGTPKVLLCPEDTGRRAATDFEEGLTNLKLSYFVGVDANPTNSTTLLCGDRHLTAPGAVHGSLLEWTPGRPIRWTSQRHKGLGNISFADGSVRPLDAAELQAALQATGAPATRLALPQ